MILNYHCIIHRFICKTETSYVTITFCCTFSPVMSKHLFIIFVKVIKSPFNALFFSYSLWWCCELRQFIFPHSFPWSLFVDPFTGHYSPTDNRTSFFSAVVAENRPEHSLCITSCSSMLKRASNLHLEFYKRIF